MSAAEVLKDITADHKLKHVDVDEKNPLPTAEGKPEKPTTYCRR